MLAGACTLDTSPPPDFVPTPSSGCPDLTGTFDLAGTALAREIAQRQPPPTHGLPVMLTFKQGPSNIEGWWVVPRERLVAFANDLSKDAPKKYASWRSLALEPGKPRNQPWDFDKYLASIIEIGPPGPTFAMIYGRGCRDGWMLVDSGTVQTTTKNGDPRQEEREIWLARDAAGNLLVRRDSYGLRHYSIWASASQSIRTSHDTLYDRVPFAPTESAAPLVDADLPPDPATVPRPRMACTEVPARVEAFSQRLKSLLPPKAQLTRFVLNPVRQQDADGNCPFASVDVEIVGGDTYLVGRAEDWLRKDADVASIEVLRPDAGRQAGTTRRLRVVLH